MKNKNVNLEKLNNTIMMEVPNTKSGKNPDGCVGHFEQRGGYNKLVAYGTAQKVGAYWVHKEYLS